jgi:hypothetical protein
MLSDCIFCRTIIFISKCKRNTGCRKLIRILHITTYISITTLWMALNYTWTYSFSIARYYTDHELMDAKVRGRLPVIKQSMQIFWHNLFRAFWLNYTLHSRHQQMQIYIHKYSLISLLHVSASLTPLTGAIVWHTKIQRHELKIAEFIDHVKNLNNFFKFRELGKNCYVVGPWKVLQKASKLQPERL